MARTQLLKIIRERIQKASEGTVFVPADFSDIAEARKVTMSLCRLLSEGELSKVKRGVYAKPRRSQFLNRGVPPKQDVVAKAIARNYGWTIVPCGDSALNILGISTQIPAVWIYVSDGPNKVYEAEGLRIQFKHTDRKNEIIGISDISALVIQAVRAIGKGNMTQEMVNLFSKKIKLNEKEIILKESRYSTAWIYEVIKLICNG